MGTIENIFIGSTRAVPEEADMLARLLDLEQLPIVDPDHIVLRGRAQTVDSYLRLVVQPNNHIERDPEPDDVQAIDGCPIEVDFSVGKEYLDRQAQEARLIFDRLVTLRPDEPVLLCHELTFLVAAYRPGGPVHEFPPRTTMDAPDIELWHSWVPARKTVRQEAATRMRDVRGVAEPT